MSTERVVISARQQLVSFLYDTWSAFYVLLIISISQEHEYNPGNYITIPKMYPLQVILRLLSSIDTVLSSIKCDLLAGLSPVGQDASPILSCQWNHLLLFVKKYFQSKTMGKTIVRQQSLQNTSLVQYMFLFLGKPLSLKNIFPAIYAQGILHGQAYMDAVSSLMHSIQPLLCIIVATMQAKRYRFCFRFLHTYIKFVLTVLTD